MDVLRRLLQALVPGGIVVDLIAVPPPERVEVGDEVLGELDQSRAIPRWLRTAAGLDALVEEGLLGAEGEEPLSVLVRFPTGRDAVDDVAQRTFTRMPAELARRVGAIEGPVAIREHSLVRRFRRLVSENSCGRPRFPTSRPGAASIRTASMSLLLAGVIGALIALIAILADAPDWYDGVYAAHSGRPDFFLWVFLIAAQMALSLALLIPTLRIVKPLYHRSNPSRRPTILAFALTISAIVIGFVLLTVLFLAPDFRIAIPVLTLRVLTLNMLSFCVVLIGAIGGWLVYFALSDDFVTTPTKASVDHFVDLRLRLNSLLSVVGLILGASIVGMAGLRNAVIAFNDESSAFPGQYLFIYGAFFSALLALAYLPIHRRALTVGRTLRDLLLPLPSGDNWTSIAEWNANRKALEEVLSLDLSANLSARTGAAILTPLVASLIGLLLQS